MTEPLSAPQRHARLIELVRAQHFVDVQELTEKFDVSVATIRRDLAELELQGLLRRTHGGALTVNQVTQDQANRDRTIANVDAKRAIAQAAAELIVEGDTVIIDAGTTSLEVAKLLGKRDGLTIITNGLDISVELANAPGKNHLFVIGGEFHALNHSFAGPLAAEAMQRFSADKAILSVSSVDLDRGTIGLSSPQFACVQRAMIAVTKSVIVVADASKFRRASLAVSADFADLDCIVTDQAAPTDADAKLSASGTILVRA